MIACSTAILCTPPAASQQIRQPIPNPRCQDGSRFSPATPPPPPLERGGEAAAGRERGGDLGSSRARLRLSDPLLGRRGRRAGAHGQRDQGSAAVAPAVQSAECVQCKERGAGCVQSINGVGSDPDTASPPNITGALQGWEPQGVPQGSAGAPPLICKRHPSTRGNCCADSDWRADHVATCDSWLSRTSHVTSHVTSCPSVRRSPVPQQRLDVGVAYAEPGRQRQHALNALKEDARSVPIGRSVGGLRRIIVVECEQC